MQKVKKIKYFLTLILLIAIAFSVFAEEKKVNYDLTKMNFNMISGVVFDMMINVEKYKGKTVRIEGQFFTTYSELMNMQTYAVLVYDETACCQTGLNFIPNKDVLVSKKFPVEKTKITVEGKLVCREINGMDYLYIAADLVNF